MMADEDCTKKTSSAEKKKYLSQGDACVKEKKGRETREMLWELKAPHMRLVPYM